ncbi:MAG: MoaD/ThiS family protein [Treponema sp.]|nr:MoaD/ThiS family protein [Treponema sp.]
MKINFYADLLKHTNNEKSFEAKYSSSIRELIDELGSHYGTQFKDFLLGEENCFFLVNGTGLMMTGGLDTKLKPDDKIEMLPFAEAG